MKKWLLLSSMVFFIFSRKLTVYAETDIPVHTSDKLDSITMQEFELYAALVMAETENQDWEAQVYAACVVMDRVESDDFPDSIEGVIYQTIPTVQFTCTQDGRLEKIISSGGANDSCMEAVQYVLDSYRIPKDVLYFTSNGYLNNTDPYLQIDDMYFSKALKR